MSSPKRSQKISSLANYSWWHLEAGPTPSNGHNPTTSRIQRLGPHLARRVQLVVGPGAGPTEGIETATGDGDGWDRGRRTFGTRADGVWPHERRRSRLPCDRLGAGRTVTPRFADPKAAVGGFHVSGQRRHVTDVKRVRCERFVGCVSYKATPFTPGNF